MTENALVENYLVKGLLNIYIYIYSHYKLGPKNDFYFRRLIYIFSLTVAIAKLSTDIRIILDVSFFTIQMIQMIYFYKCAIPMYYINFLMIMIRFLYGMVHVY